MASEENPSLNQYLTNAVCICVNDDFLCIGQVLYVEEKMQTVLLKDARFITLNETDKVGIPEIVSAVTSFEAFDSICKSMSTPIERFVFSSPKYILSVVDEIKRVYVTATKNDKAIIRSHNPIHTNRSRTKGEWDYTL